MRVLHQSPPSARLFGTCGVQRLAPERRDMNEDLKQRAEEREWSLPQPRDVGPVHLVDMDVAAAIATAPTLEARRDVGARRIAASIIGELLA